LKLFEKSTFFQKMEHEHTQFHYLIEENLKCVKEGGCFIKDGNKDEIVQRFVKAEEHSNNLFKLMDSFVEEIGDNFDISDFLSESVKISSL